MISEAGERPTAITTKHKTGGDGEEVGAEPSTYQLMLPSITMRGSCHAFSRRLVQRRRGGPGRPVQGQGPRRIRNHWAGFDGHG
jgi:hypothetical protein